MFKKKPITSAYVDPRQAYPELGRLTRLFWEQDWADSIDGNERLLALEVVGRMCREYVDVWLADPAQSMNVQAEIKQVLDVTKDAATCEKALGIENHLTDFYGIDIRKLLNNIQVLLATNGRVVY